MKRFAELLSVLFLVAVTGQGAVIIGGGRPPAGGGSSSNYSVVAAGTMNVTNGFWLGTNQTVRISQAGGLFQIYHAGLGGYLFTFDESTEETVIGSSNGGGVTAPRLFSSSSNNVTGNLNAGSLSLTDAVMVPASNLTNYTLSSGSGESTLNMTNAVRFTLLSGGAAGVKQFPCVTLTNFSGSAQTIAFTNTWVPYGSFTNSVADGKTARCCFEVEGDNVRYSLIVSP